MAWADRYISELNRGRFVEAIVHGGSMEPKIKSGSRVLIYPVNFADSVEIGDIVLCRVKGSQYLHIVKDIRKDRYLIGNNRGGINGWTKNIYGIYIRTLKNKY